MKKKTIKFPEKTKDYEKRHKVVAKKMPAPVVPQKRPDLPLAETPEPQMMM